MSGHGGGSGSSGALTGYRIAVTRPEELAGGLAAALRGHGAEPVLLPLVRTIAAADRAPLQAAAERIHSYGWIVMTSAAAVRYLRAALAAVGAADIRPAARIAVVGPATGEAVTELLGWDVAVMPTEFVGSAVAAAMAEVAPLEGVRVLWPRARDARDELRRDLIAAGSVLDAPVAYCTHPVPDSARQIAALATAGSLHVVTLTAPSAARCLAAARPPASLIVAVIGPSTAQAARAGGLSVHVEPVQHTIPELVTALVEYLR
jgi:uroporphyrinogen III methyltransferase / synthase